MERPEFQSLFRELISHIYDYTVLETHPIIDMVTPPEGFNGSRGEFLRQLILDEIENFKPGDDEPSTHDIAWRPYHILRQRYIDGLNLQDIAATLALSDRQLRRDNSRALQALSGRIWDKLISLDEGLEKGISIEQDQPGFPASLEVLDLKEIVTGIYELLKNRVEADGHKLEIPAEVKSVSVMADRIVIRQILISLISYFLNFPCQPRIKLKIDQNEDSAKVIVNAQLTEPWNQEDEADHPEFLESAYHWSKRINAVILESHPPQGSTGEIELVFAIPLVMQPVILIVDDQEPTHKMFRRFLSHRDYQIVGITDPDETISVAHQLKPILITLDVMMPKMDGWELLQSLQSDPDTKQIPILVCSAWEEPELAKSLGAAGFISKPIRQRDLLAALDRLDL